MWRRSGWRKQLSVAWGKNEIEELNDDYETQEFLNNIILIGSDGGDMA